MSDEDKTPRDSNPSSDTADDAPDSMEEVLAEALAEEESFDDDDVGTPSIDEVDIRDALREALKAPPEVSITEGVQKKLREDPELKGQFFADGWSTAKSPKETYLVTSLVMLAVAIIVYFLIRPYGM